MKALVYLYNRDGLPGVDELRANPTAGEGESFNPMATLLNTFDLVIDDTHHVLAVESILRDDWEMRD